jgi:superfamily I DNA/RNA helicase/mRNA-degrading endonuclease RelE of RelBE toxin-antitoxin system
MNFRIADTFTDSLAKLTGEEQKAVKTTAFELQMNPAGSGKSFHKLEKAKDKNFWSVRVSSDVRLIVHKTASSLLLCYVDHHDKAYAWAERRKLETHPKTGAAQLIEVREMVQEITVPVYVTKKGSAPPKPPLFADTPREELLTYGVPEEWLDDVMAVNEDGLLYLADKLPGEAAEALLELATGGKPQVAPVAKPEADPFEHPDAQRRFRVMTNVEELERALEFPWEKWTIFLHPSQRQLVEKNFSGPARAAGSAGTGKTIVALHRAVWLTRQNPDSRVLLTTFSDPLADALRTRLYRLIHNQPMLAERLEVHSLDSIAKRIGRARFGKLDLATDEQIKALLADAARDVTESRFTANFLWDEWSNVVDAWQLKSWEKYRDVQRLGRRTRLSEPQRKLLWGIFSNVRKQLEIDSLLTRADVFAKVAAGIASGNHPPFEFAVIDEAQDIGVPELRFLAAMGTNRPDSLFFAGDLGQRIFRQPFSWKALGVDVRGRSVTLRVNYRTSHQIRRQADRLLPPELADVDGNAESRKGTVSVFNGPEPQINVYDSTEEESSAVADWMKQLIDEGFQPLEIGVFVRSEAQIERAESAVAAADLESIQLTGRVESTSGCVVISPMHLAKGLEFRAVVVMACDDEVIPLQERIETVADSSDLEEIYNTERHLLYVACTRARDRLFVTAVSPASEFLDDLNEERDQDPGPVH